MGYYDKAIEKNRKKKSVFFRSLVWALELLALALSILERSRIARFLSTKVTLDVVVEVTDKFGPEAGHRLASVMAAIVAEPMIIAYALAGILVFINLAALLLRRERKHRP